MTFLINIFKFLLNVLYLFFKLFKTRDQITLISRQSNTITDDFELLKKELEKKYKVVVLCKKMENKILYAFHMIVQMYHISRSKVVILDSYSIVVSNLKHKKDLNLIQIWHALGLIKKAGYSILDKEEGRSSKTSIALNMHKKYDYVFTTSENCISAMSEVFGCNESIVYSVPLPRIDLLKNKEYISKKQNEIYKIYPKLKDKKNIIYAPTFRKDEEVMKEKVMELVDSFNYKKYNLIIKLHPLSKIEINDSRVIKDTKFSSLEMMYVSDIVIGDYSSLTYEAGILNKKQIFYAFDLNSYKGKRDFFINYEKEIPGPILENAKDIIDFIDKNDYTKYRNNKFISKYVDINIKNYTKNMCKYIDRIMMKGKI